MKHAIIVYNSGAEHESCIDIYTSPDNYIRLAQAEYTDEQLAAFESEAKNWLLKCSGSASFYADSDSGEDATGSYCEYFDPDAETAIFDNGRLVGFYVCDGGFDYSGNGRSSFSIDGWRFHDPFSSYNRSSPTYVFLLGVQETHTNGDWTLLRRDPDASYTPYLSF